MSVGQTSREISLPFYSSTVSASGNQYSIVIIRFEHDDHEEGEFPMAKDDMAEAIQTALAGLSGATSATLERHSETITNL